MIPSLVDTSLDFGLFRVVRPHSNRAIGCLSLSETPPHSNQAIGCLSVSETPPHSNRAIACLSVSETPPHSNRAIGCLSVSDTPPHSNRAIGYLSVSETPPHSHRAIGHLSVLETPPHSNRAIRCLSVSETPSHSHRPIGCLSVSEIPPHSHRAIGHLSVSETRHIVIKLLGICPYMAGESRSEIRPPRHRGSEGSWPGNICLKVNWTATFCKCAGVAAGGTGNGGDGRRGSWVSCRERQRQQLHRARGKSYRAVKYTQCWFNSGPPSWTVSRNWTSIWWMYHAIKGYGVWCSTPSPADYCLAVRCSVIRAVRLLFRAVRRDCSGADRTHTATS